MRYVGSREELERKGWRGDRGGEDEQVEGRREGQFGGAQWWGEGWGMLEEEEDEMRIGGRRTMGQGGGEEE